MNTGLVDSANGAGCKSLTATVCASIREDIVHGRIVPGAKLRIAALGERFGVAGSAVREALSRLVADGLVRYEEQRGYWVTPVSLDDLIDITRVRILIESQALREAIASADTDWEAKILAAYHRLSKTGALDRNREVRRSDQRALLHREFHDALIAGCKSRWLLRLHGVMYEQTERYRRLSVRYMELSRNRYARAIDDEHRRLMELALARDADGAAKAIAHHLEATARNIIEVERRRKHSLLQGGLPHR